MSKRITRSQSIYISKEMLKRRSLRSQSLLLSQPQKKNLQRTLEQSKRDEKRSAKCNNLHESKEFLTPKLASITKPEAVLLSGPSKNIKTQLKQNLKPERDEKRSTELDNSEKSMVKRLLPTTVTPSFARITRSKTVLLSEPAKIRYQLKKTSRRTMDQTQKDEKRFPESDNSDKSSVKKLSPKMLTSKMTNASKTQEKEVDLKGKTLKDTTKENLPPTPSEKVKNIQNETLISLSTASSTRISEIQNETLFPSNDSLPTASSTQVIDVQNESQVTSTTDEETKAEVTLSTVNPDEERRESLKRKFCTLENATTSSRRSLRPRGEQTKKTRFERNLRLFAPRLRLSTRCGESSAQNQIPMVQTTAINRRRFTCCSFEKKNLQDVTNLPAKINVTGGDAHQPAKPVHRGISTKAARRVCAVGPTKKAQSVKAATLGNTARPAKRNEITIPSDLKLVLVDDAKNVNIQKKLNKINADHNAAKVINDYVALKSNELCTIHSSGIIPTQIFNSIIQYFDTLGKQLLYEEERTQYEETLRMYPDEAMSKIYPPIYLLRLMVRLNTKLSFSCRDPETLQWIIGHVNDLLAYLSENKFVLFELNGVY